ncbi:DUF3159 domain-containing protein [Blastococcus sp. BMG 814]|uniref:DUF3159 domain-containing protein n=1 Tax=Blastococcus carthaginiensis TaxID=3050034 RepID=A0ABT9IAH8_9ACTN|nr:DUF3159 domain-containing protein [Blastococcus carthaginiensis]MDP5182578.1 DUF3159 domain-containing protein [Blastococcus carthaginiensis]
MTAAGRPDDGEDGPETGSSTSVFDREKLLSQLGGWRGMVDATLPTIAFIVANGLAGLRTGIWAAVAAAVVVFALRLARRQSVQQAVSGLIGVGIAVAIAANTGEARDFFVLGIVRSLVVGVVLLGSIPFRWPLVGVVAEFLAPSHLGSMAAHSMPWNRRAAQGTEPAASTPVRPDPTAAPQLHWRREPRLLRAYSWLTALWAASFLLRAGVQWVLYRADEVELLGTASVVLGLPLTAVVLVITLWVVARLHRHRSPGPPETDRTA